MSKGRKKKPTQLKKIQGTLRKYREVENEMQVDLCEIIPDPPIWLSKIGKSEWEKVTNQLFNLQMLHVVDLKMVEAYCNEMSLYIECEQALREGGRIDEFFNAEGDVVRRQAKPLIKVKNDALANALKLAVNFGITPSARANISAPVTTNNTQINNYFD